MHTITRKFTFDAGHRVMEHEGKCRHIHGHTYTAEVTVRAHRPTKVKGRSGSYTAYSQSLDDLGMVIDFSVVKDSIGGWINDCWDHNYICRSDDPLIALGKLMKEQGIWKDRYAPFDGRAPYVMDDNPTAENLAKKLFEVATDLLASRDIVPVNVRIWETPNCYADYYEEK